MKHVIVLFASLLATVVLAQTPTPNPDVNSSGALPESAADGVENAVRPSPRPSILQYLRSTSNHDILIKLVEKIPDLPGNFDNPGSRFTLFAPEDNAFMDFVRSQGVDVSDEQDTVDALGTLVASLQNVPNFPTLDGILKYHLLGRAVPYARLEINVTVATTQGQNLTFADNVIQDLDFSRGNASVSTKNVFCLNGWVNSIQGVLLPVDLREAIAIAETLPKPTITPSPVVPTPDADGVIPNPDGDTLPDTDPDATDDDDESEPSVTPDEDEDEESTCFPADATVRLASGATLRMADLSAGHEISLGPQGSSHTSKVFLFTHRMASVTRSFRRLTTASGHVVTLTPGHYLYANGRLVAAEAVVVGDVLSTISGSSPVRTVETVMKKGLYAPHTVHGDLVVDGIYVSGYSRTLHPHIAHALLAPIRAFVAATGIVEPFGAMFYNGADRLVPFLPKGANIY